MQVKFDNKERHLIEEQIKQFWLVRQQDVNLEKEKGSCGVQLCMVYRNTATIYRCLFACLLQISLKRSPSLGHLKHKGLNSKI